MPTRKTTTRKSTAKKTTKRPAKKSTPKKTPRKKKMEATSTNGKPEHGYRPAQVRALTLLKNTKPNRMD